MLHLVRRAGVKEKSSIERRVIREISLVTTDIMFPVLKEKEGGSHSQESRFSTDLLKSGFVRMSHFKTEGFFA